jgi:hypothetical protein
VPLTSEPFFADRPAAVASHPTIRAISWINAIDSRAPAVLDRSLDNLAWRHGWVETCTFGGSDMDAMAKDYKEIIRIGKEVYKLIGGTFCSSVRTIRRIGKRRVGSRDARLRGELYRLSQGSALRQATLELVRLPLS